MFHDDRVSCVILYHLEERERERDRCMEFEALYRRINRSSFLIDMDRNWGDNSPGKMEINSEECWHTTLLSNIFLNSDTLQKIVNVAYEPCYY